MQPITTRHLQDLEELFSGLMPLIGAYEDLNIVVLDNTYYALPSRLMEVVLDEFYVGGSQSNLIRNAYFVFHLEADTVTLKILKTRIPFALISSRISRSRYDVMDSTQKATIK